MSRESNCESSIMLGITPLPGTPQLPSYESRKGMKRGSLRVGRGRKFVQGSTCDKDMHTLDSARYAI